MTFHTEDHNELRKYLLGDLTQEARQRIEQRLLTENNFLEELLLGEEELIDDYVVGDLSDEDRLKFERHFLSTPERHQQLRFARALSRYASNSAEKAGSKSATAHTPAPPTWAERTRAFWNSRAWALAAMALAFVVIAGSWLWLSRPRTSSPQTFATIILPAGLSTRAEGAQASKVRLPLNADALRISLMLPEGTTPAASYRVELVNESGEARSLKVAGQDAQAVSVLIPAGQLARGRYALKLFADGADGTEQRVSGDSYLFTVE
jgi:anti-sigma-K factor RskA